MGKGGENEKAAIDFARLSLFLCRNEVILLIFIRSCNMLIVNCL